MKYLVFFNMIWIDYFVCGRVVFRFFIIDENIQFLLEKYVLIIFMYLLLFQVEKRVYYNALERKRRDYIKDSFYSFRDFVLVL